MKNFIVVLRNVGAVCCIGAAVIVFVMNMVSFFEAAHVSLEVAYAEAKMALGVNFLLIPVIILAIVLLKAEEKKRNGFLWFCCVCGVLSSGAWGFFCLLSGFAVGRILMPIVLFWIVMNACMAILCTAAYFANRNSFTEDYDYDCETEL